jgi:hypothetical protein
MIPTQQTLLGKGGNCLAACLASIFEVPIEDVDSAALRGEGVGSQWPALNEVCHRFGYQPFSYSPGGPSFPPIAPPGLHIACNHSHATVAFDGRVLVRSPSARDRSRRDHRVDPSPADRPRGVGAPMSDDNIATPSTAATSLSWMPIFVDDILALAATLSPAQLGGLMRLRAYAWRQSPPATLPDSDARLATIAGLSASWAEDGPPIREHLVPIGDLHDGKGDRLLDPWLEKVYQQQLARYISAATRGGKGGRPRKGEPKIGKQMEKLGESSAFTTISDVLPEKSSAKAQLEPNESSASRELSFPLSSRLKSSSLTQNTDETKAGGKLSFSGEELPERSVAAGLKQREDEWLAANPGKQLPWNFHLAPPGAPERRAGSTLSDPYTDADERATSDAAQQEARERALSDEYWQEMYESVDRWHASHDREYRDHVDEVVHKLGYLNRDALTEQQQEAVNRAVTIRIRDAEGWPLQWTWVKRRLATQMRTTMAVPA